MRVLLVSAHGADRTYGGAERYVDDLGVALRERGHDVDVLSAFPVRDRSSATVVLHRTDWREDRVRRLRNHAGDWLAHPGPRVHDVLRELSPDLVHTSNLPGISSAIWEQARSLGIPVVHTLHDYHLLCPRTSLTRRDGSPCRPSPLLCGLRTRRLARWAPAVGAVIGVSSHVLGRHAGFFPPATERRVIRAPLVPLGVECPSSPGTLPRTLGYLGALTESKGVALLLAAAPRLAATGIELRVAGDGPLRTAVQDTAGLQYAGRLEGDAVPAFLGGCDLGVIPSLWEEPGLTYVLFEWLAAGRPVLCTRRGGLSEAASLPGVAAFEASVGGLLDAVAALQAPARWRALVDSVPSDPAASDLERWVGEHVEAYGAAGVRA
jgi:glycosyltransferase involved in cell wall biosynthesis